MSETEGQARLALSARQAAQPCPDCKRRPEVRRITVADAGTEREDLQVEAAAADANPFEAALAYRFQCKPCSLSTRWRTELAEALLDWNRATARRKLTRYLEPTSSPRRRP